MPCPPQIFFSSQGYRLLFCLLIAVITFSIALLLLLGAVFD